MDKPASAGVAGPARAMGATLLALARVRGELLGVELREEAGRRKRQVVLAFVAAVFLFAALLLVAFLVVVHFWDTHRLAAIVGVTALYAAIGAGACLRLAWSLRHGPPPFAASLGELRKDLEMLQGHDE